MADLDLEATRQANIRARQELMTSLNLGSSSKTRSQKEAPVAAPATKKRKIATAPQIPERASARIASSGPRPVYNDKDTVKYDYLKPKVKGRATRTNAIKQSESDDELSTSKGLVASIDAERVRENWTKWEASAEPPKRDEYGTFHFEDYPEFMPNKSPEEMLREGVFGGSFFRPLKSRKLGIVVEDDWKELPPAWTAGLNVERFLTNDEYDPDVNKYKVKCGQSIEQWEAAGWIAHEYDIRGWFLWYCRFFQGRRCEDDDRQVSRWNRCVGAKGRWKRALLSKYQKMGVRHVFDDGEDEETQEVSPVIHQTTFQWAYEITQHDLDEMWER